MLRIGLGAHPEHQVNHEARASRGGHQLAAHEMDPEPDKAGQDQQAYAVQGCNYRDGDRKSNIRMLTGTIKADWRQLPVERYDVSMLGADNLRKVAGYDFHLLWKKYDVQSMWDDLDPQWQLEEPA